VPRSVRFALLPWILAGVATGCSGYFNDPEKQSGFDDLVQASDQATASYNALVRAWNPCTDLRDKPFFDCVQQGGLASRLEQDLARKHEQALKSRHQLSGECAERARNMVDHTDAELWAARELADSFAASDETALNPKMDVLETLTGQDADLFTPPESCLR
jgi:hypothetical protein